MVFNLTTLPPNEPGYSLSVWAHAPPGNGTVTNTSIAAAASKHRPLLVCTAIVDTCTVATVDPENLVYVLLHYVCIITFISSLLLFVSPAPNVSYSTDTAMVSQGAIFILVGEVSHTLHTTH